MLALPAALVFLAGEVYVRNVRPHNDLWVLTGREIGPNPMSSWALLDAFSAYRGRPGKYVNQATGKYQTINDHGFISTPALSLSKREGTIRIVFLGESSTAGAGLSDEETWPWLTIKLLEKETRNVNVELINAALNGYTSFESYGRLWGRVRFFSPDAVVVCHGWNELYYFDKSDDLTTWRTLPDTSWGFDRTLEPIVTYQPRWFDHLLHFSQILTNLRIRYSQPVGVELGGIPPSQTLREEFDPRGLAFFRANLVLIRAATKLLNAKLFVARQATLITPRASSEEQLRSGIHLHGFSYQAHIDAFQKIYRVIDEEIEAERIIDLTPISGRREFFFDHIHPTEVGAREIAAIVAEVLLREMPELR